MSAAVPTATSASSLRRDLIQRARTDGGGPGTVRHPEVPMSRQSPLGSHGHDMYPQEFVRLSGCQQTSLRARQAALHH